MKRRVWVAAGLVVAALAGGAAPGAARAEPRAVVDDPAYDFGTVEQGTPVDHAFKVRNVGDAPLRIDHVKGSCACTVGAATGSELAPGEATWVAVRFDTARVAGRTAKAVTLLTNDPSQPSQPLTLYGSVVTDLVLSPTMLYVGHVPQGQTIRREVTIAQGRADAQSLVSVVESGTPSVRASLEAGRQPGTQTLVVEVEPTLQPGRFDDVVRLQTTSARQPSIELPVFGTVEGDVAVLPAEVTFGLDRSGHAPAHEVRIRNRSRRPMTVTRVTAPEAVDYQLTTVREGVEYLLKLQLRDDLPGAGALDGQVEVYTTHPAESRIVVPVYAIERRHG